MLEAAKAYLAIKKICQEEHLDAMTIRSHFESGIGVAIQGALPMTDYTIFKWGGPRLERYFVMEAKAVETPYSNHFCRTQITLAANPFLIPHSSFLLQYDPKRRSLSHYRRFHKDLAFVVFLDDAL